MSEVGDKLDLLLEKVTRIDAQLFPDGPYQPSLLTTYDERISKLETWRSYLLGAWGLVLTWLTIRFGVHR